LDVAIAENGLLSVFLGNGDGTFQPNVDYGSDGSPSVFATGDFNRDGLIDFVITNFNGNNATNVSTLLGNGDGTFGRIASYATGIWPGGIVSADFNGDGNLDLAAVNEVSSNVSVLLGSGGGKFGSAVNYGISGSGYGAIVAADFNGDGHPDLATVNYSAGTVSILLNQGNGTFGSYKDFPAGTDPDAIVSGDFNNDGKMDLVVGNGNAGLSLLLGNGQGGFGTPVAFGAGLNPTGIVAGDFNGDGNLDLAAVSYSTNTVSILLGKGNGTFAPAVNYSIGGSGPVAVMAEDFNKDRKIDLAVLTSFVSEVSVLLGNGDGTFQSYISYPAPGYGSAFVAGDFHKKNVLDLAMLGSGSNDVYLLPGDGKGHFGSLTTYYAGIGPVSLVAADFGNNGSTDLALTNAIYDTDTVTVMLNGAVVSLSSGSLTFPKTAIGSTSKARKLEFGNPGTAPVEISSIGIAGADAGDFSETNSCGNSLAVGKSCTVSVDFQPTQKGQRSAALLFNDTALSGSQTVPLTGTGQ